MPSPAALIARLSLISSGTRPMIDVRKPKMMTSRRERRRFPVRRKRQSASMPPDSVPSGAAMGAGMSEAKIERLFNFAMR